jgi:hypothetical protein
MHDGILRRYIRVLRPTLPNGVIKWAWGYIVAEIVMPFLVFVSELVWGRKLTNADIIVSSLGVLGGLLFAHAIFVFQLRMDYTRSVEKYIKEGKTSGENLNLTRQIDELFDSVVYCSALALMITIAVGLSSSLGLYASMSCMTQRLVSALLLAAIAHLAGCIYRVLKTTSSAYNEVRTGKLPV